MITVDDYAWLSSPEGLSAWRKIANFSASSSDAIRSATGVSAHLAPLLLEQWQYARGKARTKVENPDCWFWNQRLFEQASDEWTARETALDAPSDCENWIDVCCGAGLDYVALARRHSQVSGVDIEPIAIHLARGNARMNQVDPQLHERSAESLPLDRSMFLNIDPDRRSDGQRTIDPSRSQPSWPWIARAIAKCGAISLKLAPGLRTAEDFDWCGAPLPQAMRWLSWDGSVRQQRWYWGLDRWPDKARIISSGNRNHGWYHEIFQPESDIRNLNSARFIEDASGMVTGYIADQDPVVRAAGVSELLAERIGATCIGDRNGYFYRQTPSFHPMLRWFHILDVVAIDSKRIRAMARSLKACYWELKSRGVEIDLDAMRRQLHVDSASHRHITLLFTRTGKKRFAVVAERMERKDE